MGVKPGPRLAAAAKPCRPNLTSRRSEPGGRAKAVLRAGNRVPGFAFLLPLGIGIVSLAAGGRIAFEYARCWAREGEASVLIAVVRNGPAPGQVSVAYGTTNGTAKAATDSSHVSGALDFAAGERLKLFTIPILNDGDRNGNRAFTVGLGELTGDASLGSPRSASIALMDNDPWVQFGQNRLWVQQTEASVTLTVTRGNDIHLDAFDVEYTTTNGTAEAGRDFVPVAGTWTQGMPRPWAGRWGAERRSSAAGWTHGRVSPSSDQPRGFLLGPESRGAHA